MNIKDFMWASKGAGLIESVRDLRSDKGKGDVFGRVCRINAMGNVVEAHVPEVSQGIFRDIPEVGTGTPVWVECTVGLNYRGDTQLTIVSVERYADYLERTSSASSAASSQSTLRKAG